MQGLTGLVLMDFRFLAALGMTGRRGWIIATIPFCLPLSARRGRDTERGYPLHGTYDRNTAIPAWGKNTSRFPWRSRCIVIR